MNTESDSVTVVVVDHERCRVGSALDSDAALTLFAIASEDPNSWDEVIGYWPRYRTPVVPEFGDALPISAVDRETVNHAVQTTDAWVVIDLIKKRIVTGRDFMAVDRDQCFAMSVDEENKQQYPLSVHLPPWWELHEQVDANMIDQPRLSPIDVPKVNREVLFGDAMLGDLATRILNIVRSDRWQSSAAADNDLSRHKFTVEVHRDWLMTPREDLGGLMPRQLLHGAHDWIDRVVWAQQIRFQDGGEIVAASKDVAGYGTAPMGGEEVVIYFDLCRELIEAGWSWCEREQAKGVNLDAECRSELIEFLRAVKKEWLASPYEGGSPPSFIIECSRRRVPRGAGVAIVGMLQQETEEHVIDCDCPICNMMAEGMFGTSFSFLDGHHLDLDDEFAFSMHETREAWEKQQREFAEMSAEFERKRVEREAAGDSEPDEFASAWSGHVSDAPLPGDPSGHLKLAFLLAEVISVLDSSGASRADIKQLNTNFTEFRTCERDQLAVSGKRLGEQMESLAQQYPELVSRVADFRSRIEEQIRAPACESGGDVPF